MWNNFLAEIVKYLTPFDVKWNSPFTFAKQIFHSEAISLGRCQISLAAGEFRWKKHICVADVLFSGGTGQICLRFRPGMDENYGVPAVEPAGSNGPPDRCIWLVQVPQVYRQKKKRYPIGYLFFLVGEAGLEPARPQWTLEPESSESTNSTTRPYLWSFPQRGVC